MDESSLTFAAGAFVGVVQCPSTASGIWAGLSSLVISSYGSIQIVTACVRASWRFQCQIEDDWIVGWILTAVVYVVIVRFVSTTAVVHYQTTVED